MTTKLLDIRVQQNKVMRISRKLVFLIGATLGVALIPSAVMAQQSATQSVQADLLSEIQELRAEIAELRDMVERQEFQLRKMQQGRAPRPGQQQLPDAAVESDEKFYRPYVPAERQAGTPAQRPSYPDSENSAPVEEHVIEPISPSDGAYLRRGVPPVVERSVGVEVRSGAAADGEAAERPIAGSQSGVSGGGSQHTSSSMTDSASDNSTSVSGYPTNDYSVSGVTVPENQPAAAPGGVIPIPQGAVTNNRPANRHGAAQATSPSNFPRPAQQDNATAALLSEQDLYQQGFDLLRQSKHEQSINIFKQQIKHYPQGDYADDAHYWIAESMYVNRLLDGSKQYFRAIIENYNQSPRLPDAMLKTAYIEQEQGNRIEARILLQEIIQYHPRSNAAISAKNRLVELQ